MIDDRPFILNITASDGSDTHSIKTSTVHNYDDQNGVFLDSSRTRISTEMNGTHLVEIVRSVAAHLQPLPRLQTDGSVGFDLCAELDVTVPPREHMHISTGIKIGTSKYIWYTVQAGCLW